MQLSSHLLVLVLLTAVPLWDAWDARRLRRSSEGREASYVAIIVVLWLLAGWVLWLQPLRTLLTAPHAWLSPAASAALTAVVLAVVLLPVVAAVTNPSTRQKVITASSGVAHLLPRTRREMALFAAVSVTAGVCEELIFRAFLLRYLTAEPVGLPTLLAVTLAAVAFGVAHLGQGWRGVGTAAAAGLVFTGLYFATGTLLVPILVHAVIDLRALAFARFVHQASTDSNGPAVRAAAA